MGDWPPMEDSRLLARRDRITGDEYVKVGSDWHHSPFNWVNVRFSTEDYMDWAEGEGCQSWLCTMRAQVRASAFTQFWDEIFLYCGLWNPETEEFIR